MPIEPNQLPGRVIIAGHACLDVTPAFLPNGVMPRPGELAEVGPAEISPGGAVPNVGLAAARLGAPVRMVALVGDDLFGRGLLSCMSVGHADIRLHPRSNGTTGYSVVLSPPGIDRSFLHAPGVNHAFDPDADVTDDDLAGGISLHFGYPPAMQRTYADGGESLARLFARAQQRGLKTSLDLCSPGSASLKNIDWTGWMRRVLPHVDWFCPSLEELRFYLNAPTAGPAALAVKCHDFGVPVVCIKMGEDGLFFSHGGTHRMQPCLPATVISTNGAGDCTIAGLIVARLCGYEWPDALKLASAVGAFSVEAITPIGGIPSWHTVRGRAAALSGTR